MRFKSNSESPTSLSISSLPLPPLPFHSLPYVPSSPSFLLPLIQLGIWKSTPQRVWTDRARTPRGVGA